MKLDPKIFNFPDDLILISWLNRKYGIVFILGEINKQFFIDKFAWIFQKNVIDKKDSFKTMSRPRRRR